MIVIKIIMWIIIFSHTALTVMTIRWAIDEHKNNKSLYKKWTMEIEHYELNTAIIACCFDIVFILYGICFFL